MQTDQFLKFVEPTNYGFIEYHMHDNIVKHIWDCIKTAKGKSYKNKLVGQIDKSYLLTDKDNYLWKNAINKLAYEYKDRWGDGYCKIPIEGDFSLYLKDLWVNYQNQHEYNPMHDHGGIYSFAAWMKIPTWYEDQAKIDNAKDASTSFNSTFNFQYLDMFGKIQTLRYELTPEYENMLLFFPSALQHCVYPYYNCNEQRISISGNIWLKPKK